MPVGSMGRQRHKAISKASNTRLVSMRLPIDHPTTTANYN